MKYTSHIILAVLDEELAAADLEERMGRGPRLHEVDLDRSRK